MLTNYYEAQLYTTIAGDGLPATNSQRGMVWVPSVEWLAEQLAMSGKTV